MINYKQYLQVNKLIDLEMAIYKGDFEQKDLFPSRIEDMRHDSIIVAAPLKRGYLVPIPVGEEVMIRVGSEGTYYLFHTRVIDRIGGQQPVLVLSQPFKTTKIQMRKWVRVESNLPVLFRVSGSEDELIKACTIDVGGGGICLSVNSPIEKDTLLELIINFPDNFTLKTNGIVCRCSPDKMVARLGICFYNINDRDQDKIVHYVFRKQREFINKGVA